MAYSKEENHAEITVTSVRNRILQETAVPCMKLSLTDDTPSIFASKVGGIGYVPHKEQIPMDSKGYQLRLLAQIDCSQITIADFPHTGLLQFWIRNDDLCGANFDHNTEQDTFRICYHRTIDKTVTESEINEKVRNNLPYDEDYFPVTGCYGIQFSEISDAISNSDYRFEQQITELVQKYYPAQAADLLKDVDAFIAEEDEDGFGHKIGGYPGFTQWDPRDESNDNHNVLLFQLDSEFSNGKDQVLWGDCGIGNFFINREALRRCDFSDVLYNWDCY